MEHMLLTGGSGFIGRNLLESRLSGEYRIFAPSHRELDLMDEDKVAGYLKSNKIDLVLHAACKPGHRNAKDPTGIFYHNTRIFLNLSRLRDSVRKIIVIGSGAIYDNRYYRSKMKEDYYDAHVPVDEHGLSKYVIEGLISTMSNVFDLRCFGFYGKYEDHSIRFVSNMICKALFDLPLTVKQDRYFDYIHPLDLVPVIEYVFNNDPKYHSFNVTPDNSVRLSWIAEEVLRQMGKNLPILYAEPGLGYEYSGDNARLRAMMPDLEFIPLEKGISDLIEWYRGIKHTIDRNALLYDK